MMLLSSEWAMGFMLGGFIILLFSSILEALWEFGRQARADLRPSFFHGNRRTLILAGWVLCLLVGGVLLVMVDVRVGLIGIVVFWMLLPISVAPRVRKRFLPPWDDLKKELEPQGFTERNYWRRGDWWKANRKPPKPGSEPDSK
jgi:hypothetical protein